MVVKDEPSLKVTVFDVSGCNNQSIYWLFFSKLVTIVGFLYRSVTIYEMAILEMFVSKTCY